MMMMMMMMTKSPYLLTYFNLFSFRLSSLVLLYWIRCTAHFDITKFTKTSTRLAIGESLMVVCYIY